MNLKIKDCVILKEVNEDCIYAVDCNAEDDDVYFKFSGPAKIFLEKLKDGKSEKEILDFVLKTFDDCDPNQVKTDWDDFVNTIKELNLCND